jgi:hypothetical protein
MFDEIHQNIPKFVFEERQSPAKIISFIKKPI